MANQNGWNTVGTEETKKDNNGGQPQEDKLDFLATPEGEIEIRVLDEAPFFYQEWWAVKGNDGKGSSIPYKGKDDLLDKANKEFMAKVFKEADAKGLKNGSPERKKFIKAEGYDKQPFGKLKNKYLIHVLDRATGEVKLLDKGKGLFEKLKGFAMHKYHGDLRTYDVTIVRKGNGWMDTEYDAMACPEKTPLTEAELALYNEKKVDLHKLKGGEGLTPEQCLFIAEGGLWSELTQEGTHQDTTAQEMAEENARLNSVPGTLGDSGNDTVDTSKEGALSDEELASVNF
jgi:hypothetical protein